MEARHIREQELITVLLTCRSNNPVLREIRKLKPEVVELKFLERAEIPQVVGVADGVPDLPAPLPPFGPTFCRRRWFCMGVRR